MTVLIRISKSAMELEVEKVNFPSLLAGRPAHRELPAPPATGPHDQPILEKLRDPEAAGATTIPVRQLVKGAVLLPDR